MQKISYFFPLLKKMSQIGAHSNHMSKNEDVYFSHPSEQQRDENEGEFPIVKHAQKKQTLT